MVSNRAGSKRGRQGAIMAQERGRVLGRGEEGGVERRGRDERAGRGDSEQQGQ